jgi:hypothetical protein
MYLLLHYTCVCVAVINNCVSMPCLNGGSCNNAVSGYSCTCVAGYTDINCGSGGCVFLQIFLSVFCPYVLKLKTYTYAEINMQTCVCITVTNNCASSPCQNGATCTNGVNTYTCQCVPGYTGVNCALSELQFEEIGFSNHNVL